MSAKSRTAFSPNQKVQILKENFVERKDVSDICDEYGIHPSMFYRWQKKFFENGERAFRNQKDPETKKLKKQLTKLETKLNQKNEVLSELMQEHVSLKKSLGED